MRCGLNMKYGSLVIPIALAHPLHHVLETGRGIRAEISVYKTRSKRHWSVRLISTSAITSQWGFLEKALVRGCFSLYGLMSDRLFCTLKSLGLTSVSSNDLSSDQMFSLF